jgi:hypothetical protein
VLFRSALATGADLPAPPAVAAGAAATPPAAAATPPAAAAEAPLSLKLSDGSTFTLAQHAGAPMLLTFVATWCDWYLADSRPTMAAACAEHTRQAEALRRAHPKLPWLFVASPVWTAAEDVTEFRKKFTLEAPLGVDLDSAWFRHFHIRDVATTVLLDATGKELSRIRGAGTDLPQVLEKL